MPKRTAIRRLSSARRPVSSARAMLFCCACSALACDATPAYFSTVANQVLRMQGVPTGRRPECARNLPAGAAGETDHGLGRVAGPQRERPEGCAGDGTAARAFPCSAGEFHQRGGRRLEPPVQPRGGSHDGPRATAGPAADGDSGPEGGPGPAGGRAASAMGGRAQRAEGIITGGGDALVREHARKGV